jgi:carbohydrate diacid regulator
MSVVEVVRGLFPTKMKDFVTAVDERSIILVKELSERDTSDEIERIAHSIHDTLSGETLSKVYVAIGMSVNDLKNVSASYKEARMALEVGKIFDPGKNIVNYERLGIGRLIYQLPSPLCRMFIGEVLGGLSVDQFDDETLATVNKFFENNLNVSETSRQLYIHRNTLVYRLDKIQKMTGMDLRKFDDAITFKITLMVSKYMSFKDRFAY